MRPSAPPGRTSIEAKIHVECDEKIEHVSKRHRRCLCGQADKVDSRVVPFPLQVAGVRSRLRGGIAHEAFPSSSILRRTVKKGCCRARRTENAKVDGAVAASSDDKLKSSNYSMTGLTARPKSIFLPFLKSESLTTVVHRVHVVPLRRRRGGDKTRMIWRTGGVRPQFANANDPTRFTKR